MDRELASSIQYRGVCEDLGDSKRGTHKGVNGPERALPQLVLTSSRFSPRSFRRFNNFDVDTAKLVVNLLFISSVSSFPSNQPADRDRQRWHHRRLSCTATTGRSKQLNLSRVPLLGAGCS